MQGVIGATKLDDPSMISRRGVLTTLTAAAVIAGGVPAFGKSKRANPIQALDPDNDGTVDLAEAKKAGSDLDSANLRTKQDSSRV